MAAAWAQVAATVFAVIVAGFLTRIFHEQQKAKIHEKRLGAYAQLWALTKDFRINAPPISRERCHQLADKLTEWYYNPGGGMLITSQTLTVFLTLRGNLTCDPSEFFPSSWQVFLQAQDQNKQSLDQLRFLLLQRQFSLLRTQMKNDCAIYYGRDVSADALFDPYDVNFLLGTKLDKIGIWKRAIKSAKEVTEDSYLTELGKRYQGTPEISVRLG
jgi:hypothetical protein